VLTDFALPALLEELAAPREVPGAGSALAVALATSAAVVQMAARLSLDSWPDAAGVAAQAESMRDRAARLVDDDAEAYRRALEARAAADETSSPEQRDWSLGQVTAAAAEPPLALARLATDLAELCAAAGDRVEPRLRADVGAAAALAAGVARGARELVAVNLTALPNDPRLEEATKLAAVAEAATRSLLL
jgi:formiminotetrahydrofolate cyclodeaminase